jgi:hypothetical protein
MREVWDRPTQRELVRTGRDLKRKLERLSIEVDQHHSNANVARVLGSSVAALGSGTDGEAVIAGRVIWNTGG